MGRRVWKPEDGVLGALEMLDAPGEYAVDRVPTVDADVPLASYRDWDPKDTRIVTCRIGNDLFPRDERFESRDEAYKAVERRHGRILEANYAPGRAFFRVRRK